MAAEVARAQARGQDDADLSVYENAVVAVGQGMAAVSAQIDAQYDKEYALIQLIGDSTERQAAMDDLNARYLEPRWNTEKPSPDSSCRCGTANPCRRQAIRWTGSFS